jgi:hypothetical protein
MSREPWWVRLDPTRPDVWQRAQQMGDASFVCRYGIAAAGLPIAVIADLVLLTLGDNWPLFVSLRHLEQFVTLADSDRADPRRVGWIRLASVRRAASARRGFGARVPDVVLRGVRELSVL